MSSTLDVRDRVLELFAAADPAHDMSHLDRVAGLTRKLAGAEGGDLEIALLSVYLHDCHRIIERRENKEHVSIAEAWDMTAQLLSELNVPAREWDRVRQVIEQTSAYSFGQGLPPDWSIEAAIVHDADNLDAIGAVGIARAFAYGGGLGEPLWRPQVLPSDAYSPGKTSSVLAHFYEKLFRLESDMLTATGKALAQERTRVMRAFVGDFIEEWEQAIPEAGARIAEWRDRLPDRSNRPQAVGD
ncbi:HD domain-containing protein [Nocardia sp. NPDC006044]|uniref:HD domain-containing protein n=1 Tax=Nocardia sp. NPDC006044 TaxID=3364306 RepID=UPI00369A4204